LRTRIARKVTIAKRLYKLALDLHVIDNGPGIPEEIRDRIFYPLVSGRDGGSGLGLTLAQTFVQQHDGMIDARAGPDVPNFRSCCRSITERRHGDSPDSPISDRPHEADLDSRRRSIDPLGARKGARPRKLRDAQLRQRARCARRARSRAPQVLVSDIRMPGGSGLELLQAMQERLPGLPVIIMTAFSDLDSAVAAFQGGAFEYLAKPFDVDKAVELIRRAVEESLREEQRTNAWPMRPRCSARRRRCRTCSARSAGCRNRPRRC
jgi:CheY-like chemotaxis protein